VAIIREEPAGPSAYAPALLELIRLGAVERDPDRLVSLICEHAARLTGADYAGVRLSAGDGGRIQWRGMWGNRSEAWRSPRQPSERGRAREAITAGHAIVSRTEDRTREGWRPHDSSVRASEGGLVQVIAPLAYSGRVLGALILGWRSDVTPSEDQIGMAELLAGYGAVVLENARSREESERRRAEAEALAELARRGAAEQRMDAVVELVCRSACQLVGCDYAALLVRRGRGVAWLGVWGNRSDIWRQRHNPSGRGPAATSMAEARTVVFRREGEADGRLEGLQVLAAEQTETALAVPLLGREGPFGSLVAGWRQLQDVTAEQRRLSEALAGYVAVILENVQARAALQERAETVRLANEQLTRIDEMKSNLISNVSHELRTPLSSIRAFSELLLNPDVDASTRQEFARIINAESERLTRLVSNLLDLSRIQGGGVHWRFRPLRLAEQLELAVAPLRPAANEKGLELKLDIQKGSPRVTADPDGLQQAVVNLVSNAVKFTQRGGVCVSAAVCGKKVRIAVADTGPGMSQEEQAHIFDRFYQAGDILTSKPAGTGLGLAITKEILNQHGTTICLESQPGRGSCFSFVLPLA